ncbi:helix-turn-helix domain-containing protein [Seonamhaeicola maritimus]|nr:helix-turn-helix domain-containing protein [Seonamhaeicola maritimus]
MDEKFLNDLNQLLEANLNNEQFGVNELAEAANMSRSKLHRKLNNLVGKSTSQFVREYRLDKAMEMLKSNEATASEIAYSVGFSSATYFNKCFSDYFGYPPGEVKYRGTSETSQSNIKVNRKKRGGLKKSFLIVSVGVVVIAMTSYLYFLNSSAKEESVDPDTIDTIIQEKSIAVLPFKNLSDDQENQYFADGMREDIINHLSKMKGLVVKFNKSFDRYGTIKLAEEEVGTTLKVNYIIDGSVQRYDDRIKVIVHLVNAKEDTHMWSKSFDRKFSDIFSLESDIAQNIASELDLILSPNELLQLGKVPTASTEAYNLYLKGKFFLYSFSNSGLKSAEKYFNESIALDSEFALPYSGLALIRLYREWPVIPEADYKEAKKYALQAVGLDDALAETHRTLGTIYMEYEWDWELAEKEFETALSLDLNDYGTYITYAKYLMLVKGDFIKSRHYINKAIELSPINYYFYILSAENYILTKDYQSAIEEVNKAMEINIEDLWAPWLDFLVQVKQGNPDKAIEILSRSWDIAPNTRQNIQPMLEAYKKGGINEAFRWINNLDIEFADDPRTVMDNAYFIAQKFAFIGEHDEAMKWLHIALEQKNGAIYWIKYDHFFENMHFDPRFLEVLRKMNLGDYSQPFKP